MGLLSPAPAVHPGCFSSPPAPPALMRTIRPFLLALLLLLGLVPATPAQEWQARFDMGAAEFQQAFDALTPQGFVPREISIYEDAGTARYAAVWQREPEIAWRAWHDVSSARLQQLFDELTPQGFVPTHVAGYTLGGEPRFSAIWRREAGVRWESRHDLDGAALQAALNTFSRQGLAPSTISAYPSGGRTRFAAIWRSRPASTVVEARFGLSAADYQATFDRLAPRGFVPLDVSVYQEGGQTRFAAVWEQVSGAAWEARHHLSLEGYTSFTRQQAASGYAPDVIASYPLNGRRMFAGAWRYRAPRVAVADPAAERNLDRVPAGSRSRRLAIRPVRQQTQVWCWLAVGEMIFQHFGLPNVNPAGNFQCGIIGRISDPGSPCYADCMRCIRPSGSNQGTLEMIAAYGRSTAGRAFRYSEGRAISPAAVVANIDAGRPIIAGISYHARVAQADAEHVALITGYDLAGGRLSLVVNDPFPYNPGQNPFIRHGGTQVAPHQYRIDYAAFRDQVFWHWSVFNMSLG